MTRLQVFYFNAGSGAKVLSTAPMLSNLSAANRTLNSLRGDGSFLGVIVSAEITVRFCIQKDIVRLEKFNPAEQKSRYCRISLGVAEQALEALFRGGDLEQAVAPSAPLWEEGSPGAS